MTRDEMTFDVDLKQNTMNQVLVHVYHTPDAGNHVQAAIDIADALDKPLV